MCLIKGLLDLTSHVSKNGMGIIFKYQVFFSLNGLSCFCYEGYRTGGSGGGSGGGQGGSYGGLGVSVSDNTVLYGNVATPDHYGSEGAGATASTNRGGGYIKIVASDSVQIGTFFVTCQCIIFLFWVVTEFSFFLKTTFIVH